MLATAKYNGNNVVIVDAKMLEYYGEVIISQGQASTLTSVKFKDLYQVVWVIK